MLKIEHVSKTFNLGTINEKKALIDINLQLDDGDFVTVIGGNGAGKSTLMNMIAGVYPIDCGHIKLDDKDISLYPEYKRAGLIGRVFQDPMMGTAADMQIDENLAMAKRRGQKRTLKWGIKKEEKKLYYDLLKTLNLGLEERMTSKVGLLSGGQRQRVAMGRAIVREPKVFLMDEPLSNLDAKLRGQMRVELIGLHKKLGTTFVYVTHDQVEAMSMADDIVLMKDGYIVQQSSPRELYNNPNCVYAAQFIGTPQMNIVKDILPEGLQVGFRPEKVYLKDVEDEHVQIHAKIATKEMLGSEIIYSLDSPAGKLMAKSDYEAEDGSTLKLSVPVKNMYLFDKDGERIPLDDEHRLMIHAGFAKLAGREV